MYDPCPFGIEKFQKLFYFLFFSFQLRLNVIVLFGKLASRKVNSEMWCPLVINSSQGYNFGVRPVFKSQLCHQNTLLVKLFDLCLSVLICKDEI